MKKSLIGFLIVLVILPSAVLFAPRRTHSAVLLIVLAATVVANVISCTNNFYWGCGGGGSGGSGGSGSGGGSSSCTNGATNPPACNACPANYSYISPNCVTNPIINVFSITSNSGGGGASAISLDKGSSATLTWSATNADSCTATGGFSTGGATSGSATVTPTQNSTYQITCSNSGGASAVANTSVTVLNPKINSFSASPLRVLSGGNTTISWDASDVKNCTISGPGFSASGLSGSKQAVVLSQSTYTISCQTNTVPLTQSVLVNVVPNYNQF